MKPGLNLSSRLRVACLGALLAAAPTVTRALHAQDTASAPAAVQGDAARGHLDSAASHAATQATQ